MIIQSILSVQSPLIRAHVKHSKTNPWMNVPEAAFDLLSRLLDLNPQARTSADNALQHSFYTEAL